MAKTETNVDNLKINYLTREQYDEALASGSINLNEMYITPEEEEQGSSPIPTAGTGSAYTATVPHIKSLTAGMKFTMIPHVVSAAVSPTLDVNGLGAKPIRQRLSNGTASTATGATANWLAADKPVDVMYDGAFWVVDFVRPNMASAYGTLPVENGGTGATTAEQARINLGISEAGSSWPNGASPVFYLDIPWPWYNEKYKVFGKCEGFYYPQDRLGNLYESIRNNGRSIVVFNSGLAMWTCDSHPDGIVAFGYPVRGCTMRIQCEAGNAQEGLQIKDNGVTAAFKGLRPNITVDSISFYDEDRGGTSTIIDVPVNIQLGVYPSLACLHDIYSNSVGALGFMYTNVIIGSGISSLLVNGMDEGLIGKWRNNNGNVTLPSLRVSSVATIRF